MFSEALTPSPPEWFESQHDGQKDAEGGQSSSLSVDDDGLILHPRVCYFIGPGVSVCHGKAMVSTLLGMLQSVTSLICAVYQYLHYKIQTWQKGLTTKTNICGQPPASLSESVIKIFIYSCNEFLIY